MISKIFKVTTCIIITCTFHTSHLFIWLFYIFLVNKWLMKALSSATLHAFAKFTEAIILSHRFELILSRYSLAYIILILLSRRLSYYSFWWWANIARKSFKIEIWIRGCTLRCRVLGSSSLLLLHVPLQLILLPIIKTLFISFTVLCKGVYTSRSVVKIMAELIKL